MTPTADSKLDELVGSAERITVLRQLLETAEAEHALLIHEAVHDGASIEKVAAAADVPAARVRRLVRHRPSALPR